MPLLILCGIPCSGKTVTFATKFKISAEERGWNVNLINDESLLLEKNTTNVAHEKRNRATFLSAIERSTSRDNITIADSQNYIKGFRYQLYCIARAANTPHALVYCTSDFEFCKHRNENPMKNEMENYNDTNETGNSISNPIPPIYNSELFTDLCNRFEEPNPNTKWDSPLFYVSMDNDDMSNEEDSISATIKNLLDIFKGKPKNEPSMATVPKISSLHSNDLNKANQITQEMIDKIEKTRKEINSHSNNTSVQFNQNLILNIKRPLELGELKTLRNQFMNLCLKNNPHVNDIERLFVEYLNSFLNK